MRIAQSTQVPLRERSRYYSGLVLLGASFGAGVLGWLAVFDEKAAIALFLAVICILLGSVVATRVRLSLPRPADALIVASIVYLPLAPFLTPYSVAFSVLRFALAGALIAGLLAGVIPRRDHPLRLGGWLALVFVAYQLLPLVAEGLTSYGLLRFINWTMFVPLIFVRYDEKTAKYVFGAVLFTVLVLFLGILLQKQGLLKGVGGGESYGDPLSSIRVTRYTSFLQNANDLGLFMLCGGLLAYIYAVQPKRQFTARVLVGALAFLSLYSMFLASSRGAFLALPLVLLFFFMIGARRALLVAVVLAVVAVGVVDPLVPAARSSVATTFASVENVATGNAVSAKDRLTVWNQRLSNAGNFVLGTGYGGYAPGAKLAIGSPSEHQQLYGHLTVDNGWLKLWLEEGILGLLVFAGVVAYLLHNSIILIRENTAAFMRLVGMMTAGVAVAMMFRSLSADMFDINPWNCFIWLTFGLSASFCQESLRKSSRASPGNSRLS
jgi:O-antigen ligase